MPDQPHADEPPAGRLQIGAVAERTGLSLRTIRYYEEVGLVVPVARSAGGFRLYDEAAVARFAVIKRMKPLEFSLEEMRDLLAVLDDLAAAPTDPTPLLARLSDYREAVAARVRRLREQLDVADGFAAELSAVAGAAGEEDHGTRSP